MMKKYNKQFIYFSLAGLIIAGFLITGLVAIAPDNHEATNLTAGDTIGTLPAIIASGSRNLLVPRDRDADFVFGGQSSVSAQGKFVLDDVGSTMNLELDGVASISKFSLIDSSTGITMVDCDGDAQALGWDLTNQRFFCGDDDSGGGGGTQIEVQNSFVDLGSFSSISFDAGHFTATDTTGEATIKLDWGAGGPASLSEAETISGNWVNTASPWADNEVADTISVIGGIIGANSISGTQTTTGTLTIGDNGDSIIIDASNWDVSTLGKADFLSASVSTNFEATGYASASLFQGTAFGGIDCNDAADQLLWSGGVFTCEALADADIPDSITITNLSGTNTGDVTLAGTPDYITISGQTITRAKLDISDDTNATGGTGVDITTNDFTFDSTEIEATTWGAGGNASNIWTFNLSAGDPTMTWTRSGASLSLNFEATGYASASKYFGAGLGGMSGTDGCSAAGDTLNYTFSTGVFSCGSDASGGGGVSSNSLNFDELQNPLVLDGMASMTFGAFNFEFNLESTGDLKISDNGVDFVVFHDYGGASFSNPVTGTIDELLTFGATSAVLPSASFATFDTRNDFTVLDFGDSSVASKSIFIGVMPRDYDDGTATVSLHFSATSATSGNAVWDVQFERVGSGSQDIDTGGWNTANTATCSVPATSGNVVRCNLGFTNAQMDAIKKGELFRMRVIRDTTDSNDTVTGTDLELHYVEIIQ